MLGLEGVVTLKQAHFRHFDLFFCCPGGIYALHPLPFVRTSISGILLFPSAAALVMDVRGAGSLCEKLVEAGGREGGGGGG